jgi:hypothetical protein
MTESQVRALFTEIADGAAGPSRVDPQVALRRGRARRRWRRAGLAGVPVLAAAAVAAVILAMVAGPFRPGASPVTPSPGPPAPRHFSPLVPGVAFGWLPAGLSVQQGRVESTVVGAVVGSAADPLGWSVSVYARGQCHLTGAVSGLVCPAWTVGGPTARFSAPAPEVRGGSAFWAGPNLVWQYARGGWAELNIPVSSYRALRQDPAMRQTALKIAGHLRVGAATPAIMFPAQLAGLTGRWLISNVFYEADGGVLQAQSYMLLTGTSRSFPHVGDLGIWTNAPYFQIAPAARTSTCTPHDPAVRNTSEVINGYHVVLKRRTVDGHPEEEVCAARADGLAADIIEYGAHPTIGVTSLFRQLRLLGTDPASWVTDPIG